MRSWCLIFEFLKNKIRSFLIDNSKLSKQDDNDDDEIVSIIICTILNINKNIHLAVNNCFLFRIIIY